MLPEDDAKKSKLIKDAVRYVIVSGQLYRRGASQPLLRCVTREESLQVIEALHEGMCGAHVGGRALSLRVLRAGYYWPTVRTDCAEYVKKCDKCQRHSVIQRAPPETLSAIAAPWLFHKWGADILGPFPPARQQVRFLIVAVDYFTKWIEAEAVATITAARVKSFYWRNIICRFGVPYAIVSDNGAQFANSTFTEFAQMTGFRLIYSSVEHPQTNGQAELANKVILSGIKRRLDDAKGNWAEEQQNVLWTSRRTTQSSTSETPFRLTYGGDAFYPLN